MPTYATGTDARVAGERTIDHVDPRAPRFGQTLTSLGLLAGILTGTAALVYAVALVLGAAVLTRWRVDLYAFLWRGAMVPVLGPPADREPASPHRFARLLGAVGTALAGGLLLGGLPVAGYAVAGAVAVLAGFAAATGICVGCRMYRQVALFRDLGVV